MLTGKMKVLVIDDPMVSGACGLAHQIWLEQAGHTVRFINAPLVFDDKGRTSYTPDMVDHIIFTAQEFVPDWVVMVLQGMDSSRPVAVAAAIHEQSSATRFYFISGYPHNKELDHARAIGLRLHMQYMPTDFAKFGADLEQTL